MFNMLRHVQIYFVTNAAYDHNGEARGIQVKTYTKCFNLQIEQCITIYQ